MRPISRPPPISANVPYLVASRLSASAFCRVLEAASSMGRLLQCASSLYRWGGLRSTVSTVVGRCGRGRSPNGPARAEPADNIVEDRRQEDAEERHPDHAGEDRC